MNRLTAASAIYGGLAVATGAFGAHALSGALSPQQLQTWSTASTYLMFHALAALFCPAVSIGAQRLFLIGATLFSGSLFAYLLSGFKPLVFVTPLGGLVLLTAWGWLAWRLWSRSEPR